MSKKSILFAAMLVAIANVSNAADNQAVTSMFYDLSDTYIQNVSSKLNKLAEENNVKITTLDASDDALYQEQQFESIYKNADRLVLNLVDRNTAKVALDKLSKDARVVFFNREPDSKVFAENKNVFYVGTDPYESGRLQGEMIVDYLKKYKDYDVNNNGKLDVIFLKGSLNHQDTEERTTTVLSALYRDAVQLNRVAQIAADWSYDKAYAEVSRVLTAKGPENVEMIISNNDAMALGAIAALNEFGYNKANSKDYIPVFGIDGTAPALDAINLGTLTGTVRSDEDKTAKILLNLVTSNETDAEKLSKDLEVKVEENGSILVPFVKIPSAKLK